MAVDELLDDHVSVKQADLAINALHKHAIKNRQKKEESELLPGKEQHVWLVVAVKKIYPEGKLKPFKIPVKHTLVDPRQSNVCLITKDPQREYKDLLEQHKIKFISRVVGVAKLKGKWKPFEARRLLLKENDLFLADERVIPLLPGLLGKIFFEAKKQPIPVNLTKRDLKTELENAVNSTYMHQNQGTCTSIKIATINHTPSQILDNLKTALPVLISRIRDGWDNIQSLHIKTSSSVSLPVWTCNLGDGEGGRWNGLTVGKDDGEAWGGVDSEQKGSQDDGNEHQDYDEENIKSDEEPKPEPMQKKVKKRKVVDEPASKPIKKVKTAEGPPKEAPSTPLSIAPSTPAAKKTKASVVSLPSSEPPKKKKVKPDVDAPVPPPPTPATPLDASQKKKVKPKATAPDTPTGKPNSTLKKLATPSKPNAAPQEAPQPTPPKSGLKSALKQKVVPGLTTVELKAKRVKIVGGEKKKAKFLKGSPAGTKGTAKTKLLGKEKRRF